MSGKTALVTDAFGEPCGYDGPVHPPGLRGSASARTDAGTVDCVTCPAEVFDTAIAAFEDVCVDQIARYKAAQQPGRTRHVLVKRDGAVIGGATVVIYAAPGFGRGVAHVRFGPVSRRRGDPSVVDDYRDVVRALIDRFAVREGHLLTLQPRPSPDHAESEAAILQSMGFRPRDWPTGSSRFLVDLGLDPDRQMASLAQKWRYNLRKAHKAGVTAGRDDGADAYGALVAMHERMKTRKGIYLADDLTLVPLMRRSLPAAMQPRTYLAWHDGTPVAGAVVGVFGDTAYYLYGATADSALRLRAGYALQWGIVEALGAEDIRYYDLGGCSGFDGLRQFKSGLSGRAGKEIDTPAEYDFAAGLSGLAFGKSVHTLRRTKHVMINLRNRSWL